MKVIPIALQSAYDSGSTTLALGLFLIRRDGELFAFTSHDKSIVLDVSAWANDSNATAVEFDSRQGLDASNFVTSAGLDVGNAELTTLDDGTLFNRDDIFNGLWVNAQFWIFRYDYTNAADTTDVEVLMRGTTGETGVNQNTIVVELRDLAQKLQQPIGIVTQKTCRARLGDSKCTVDLGPFTHSLTVTGVTSKRLFTCAGAGQAADYFTEGIVTWITGNNTGVEVKVSYFASGVFTLVVPMWLDIQVGDTLSAVAGCQKRLSEDCITKFDNVLNFQGEPHVPVTDELTASPNPNV